jgi:S-DNA-T family DNA segregation ATPase FtsK/SpoIIIE
MAEKDKNILVHKGFKFKYCFYGMIILMLLMSLLSHQPGDFAVLQGGSDGAIKNWIGITGAHISCFMLLFFGVAAYPIMFFLMLCAMRPLFPIPVRRKGYWSAVLVICIGTTILFGMYPDEFAIRTNALGIGHSNAPELVLSGGVIGQQIAAPKTDGVRAGVLRHYIGSVGTMIVALVFITVGLFFVWCADWHMVLVHMFNRDHSPGRTDKTQAPTLSRTERKNAANDDEVIAPKTISPEIKGLSEEPEVEDDKPGKSSSLLSKFSRNKDIADKDVEIKSGGSLLSRLVNESGANVAGIPPEDELKGYAEEEKDDDSFEIKKTAPQTSPTAPELEMPEAQIYTPPPASSTGGTKIRKKSASGGKMAALEDFVLPPISMLNRGKEGSGESAEALRRSSQILQETLESFKVDGQVTGIISGPRVTRYEIQIAPGVKVEKVANIANNIAMQLEAESIRVLAPIPGRNAVGVEAPNSKPSAVYLRGLMESPEWKDNHCNIPIILGKDVAGKPVVMDLAKAPHLLIAGATGSGKSVCMNTLIMSLIYNFRPDELRLIMVDPKVVEMEMYTALPHLITPVVNDPQKVPIALRWGVNEMEKRYRMLARVKAKNLEGFNERPLPKTPVFDDNGDEIPERLPYLVIIIDELADVMMTDAKSDVETSVARIAQKGRAAGIHIVIATQRPSTNIITGVIKANLPTRIAFRVGSIVDSRVILDQKGAESLLGRGDMLFMPPGNPNIDRIQGAMVEDADIEKVVEFVASQVEQTFDDNVVSDNENGHEGGEDFEPSVSGEYIDDAPDIAPVIKKYLQSGDSELIHKALEITLLERKVSTSYLQRRLGIGYNRAAEIIDTLEERGIVSAPLPGGSKREILVFDEIENGI